MSRTMKCLFTWFALWAASVPWVTLAESMVATGPPVVVSGMVPDEATKAAIIAQLRSVYGPDRVRDQLAVSSVVAPTNWSDYVQRLINANLKKVHDGRLDIKGNDVVIEGAVENEAQRQEVVSELASNLNATYSVRNNLRVEVSAQGQLDRVLANATIRFELGTATLLPEGIQVLDRVANVLRSIPGKKLLISGHTSGEGVREQNMELSLSRAEAVRDYLVSRGIGPDTLETVGYGPDRPVASNDTQDGRARNRRIEFAVAGY